MGRHGSTVQTLWRRDILTERPSQRGQLQNMRVSTKRQNIWSINIHSYDFVLAVVEILSVCIDNALIFIQQSGRRLTDATDEQLETEYQGFIYRDLFGLHILLPPLLSFPSPSFVPITSFPFSPTVGVRGINYTV